MTICFGQIKLEWYIRPDMKSVQGYNVFNNCHLLKQKEIIVNGDLGGRFSFNSIFDTTSASPFLAEFDATYNLKLLKRFNYSTGSDTIIESEVDTNDNFYGNIFYPSGNWNFDNSSIQNFNYTTSDGIFIAYDKNFNIVNHIDFINTSCYWLGFYNGINPMVKTQFNNDSIHIKIYSAYFTYLIREKSFPNSWTIKHFRETSDKNFIMDRQSGLAIYDTLLQLKNSISLNGNVLWYSSYLSNHCYLNGSYSGTQYLVNGNNLSAMQASDNHFIACLDNNLNLKWVKTYYIQNYYDGLYPIQRDNHVSVGTPPVFAMYG